MKKAPRSPAGRRRSRKKDEPARAAGVAVPQACLAAFGIIWIALAIAPKYRADWVLENLLTFAIVPLLIVTYRSFRFSDRAYVQGTFFLILHTIGSHYTYAETPIGDWLRPIFGFERNHYDRIVHFSFGALLFLPLRELIGRRSGPSAAALDLLGVSAVIALSAIYEIVEWLTASVADPAAGTAYLGTQGDEWDAQKDMALAWGGGVLAGLAERLHRLRRRPTACKPPPGSAR